MPQARLGDRVVVHYTGMLQDGTVFDSSRGRDPLAFTLGTGEVISGFETAVEGMQAGETKETTIVPNQAYGDYQDDLQFTVDRTQLPAAIDPKVGEQYQMRQADGQTIVVTVHTISSDEVVFDANHPLAGQELTFQIEVVDIEQNSPA